MNMKQFPVIDPIATGKNIIRLRVERGMSVRDLQAYFGFEEPQAIYKWVSGKSLPSLDNFVILSRLLHTSIENIHKVIDPLFLDALKAELNEILARPRSDSWRTRLLTAFQTKLSQLTFFAPACGSGNFLTETYLSLRRVENMIIADQTKESLGQIVMRGLGADFAGIKVSISQFMVSKSMILL